MYNKKSKVIFSVFLTSILFISLLVFSQFFLSNKISKSERDYYNNQLKTILKAIEYDNILLNSEQKVTEPKFLSYLGNRQQYLYTAFLNKKPQALIISTTAPDGYNGDITILVAIKLSNDNKHKILNVKILQHNETPGLGDLIEPNKSSWLEQFINRQLINNTKYSIPWPVSKAVNNNDNGIDSITGATITSRAVTNAIYNSLLLITKHPEIYKNNSDQSA